MDAPWQTFKTHHVVPKKLPLQYFDFDSHYMILAFDGPLEIRSRVEKDSGADCLDFEENFLPTVNQRLGPIVDEDGAQIINPKFAGSGRAYNSLHFEVTIGIAGSLYCKDRNGDNLSFVQSWTKKPDGSTITDPADNALAVETVVLLGPQFDYDIQGFCLYQNTRPATDIRMWGVLAPFAPVEYGGQKEVITGVNLRLSPYDKTFMDYVGDSATPVKYLGPGSNEQMLIFKHEAGTSHKVMGELFWYV